MVCVVYTREHIEAEKNGWHFADDNLKFIFLNGNNCILIQISLKFVRKGPINNKPALVQRMVWRRTGDKPLSEPVMFWFTDAHIGFGDLGFERKRRFLLTISRLMHIHHERKLSVVSSFKRNTSRPKKMAAISQTTFSNAFSEMKMYEFRLRFHLSLFLRLELTIYQHWFR